MPWRTASTSLSPWPCRAWLEVPGLALAYAGAYGVAAVGAMVVLGRRTGGHLGGSVTAVLARPVAAAAIMAGAVRLAVTALPDTTPDGAVVAVGVLLGGATYAAALAALGVSEAGDLLARVRRRVR